MEDEDKKIDVYLTDEQFKVLADIRTKYAKGNKIRSWITTIAFVLACFALTYFVCLILCEKYL